MPEEDNSGTDSGERRDEEEESKPTETPSEEISQEPSQEPKEEKPEIKFEVPEKKAEKPSFEPSTGTESSGGKSMYIIMAVVIFIVGFSAGFLVNGSFTGQAVQNILAPAQINQKVMDYLNDNILQEGITASIENITQDAGLYNLLIRVSTPDGDSDVSSYVTMDGGMLFLSAINLDVPVSQGQPSGETGIPKSEIPVANAFVMSYCPYGLQFLKAYVPVIELLGDSAEVEVNFVHYAMHGKKEIDENTRMYCIQKEQKDKLADYLRCFLASDDPESCIQETGIDKDMLESCIDSTDKEFRITELYNDQSTWSGGRFPLYPVDAALAEQYGVGGSPTFIINGEVVTVNRSPEAIKQAICSAFTNPPEECSQTLSTGAEAPGIGPIGSGSESGSSGQC